MLVSPLNAALVRSQFSPKRPRQYRLIHPLRVGPPTRHLGLALDGIRLREQRFDLRDNARANE